MEDMIDIDGLERTRHRVGEGHDRVAIFLVLRFLVN